MPCLELLRREIVKKVQHGPELLEYTQVVRKSMTVGVCSKRAWTSGCESCHYEHARRTQPGMERVRPGGSGRRVRLDVGDTAEQLP